MILHSKCWSNIYEKILTTTARIKGTGPKDLKYGAGILDAAAALGGTSEGGNNDGNELIIIILILVIAWILLKFLRKLYPRTEVSWAIGLLLGGFGLTGLVSSNMSILSAPLLSWDYALFGLAGSGSMLLRSCLIPVAGLCLLSGIKSLRGFLSGLFYGISAFLISQAVWYSVDLTFIDGSYYDRLWLMGNGIISFFAAFSMDVLRTKE